MAPAHPETVPARRLGTLLAEARVVRARTLDEVAAATSFDPVELGRVEAGDRPLSPIELETVCAAYGVAPEALVPDRGPVAIDLDARRVVVAGATVPLGREPTADDVLVAYLSLVYSLRHARPGSPLVLRDFDLAVLARGLDLARPEVDRRLHTLMAQPLAEASLGRRRRRVVIAVGSVVVVLGIVLGVLAHRSDDPAPTAPTRSSTVPPASLIPPANVSNDPAGG